MADNDLPQCKVCYEPMSAKFRDFSVCFRCQIAQDRAKAARPRLNQPSYTSPLNRLDREEHAARVRD